MPRVGRLKRGSSPRVRGTLSRRACRVRVHRFIPACAGNTIATLPIERRVPVHPRVCGEHLPIHNTGKPYNGSSPRVRGTHEPTQPRPARHRFIPACAGNTCVSLGRPKVDTVHPRVCGEHSRRPPRRRRDIGSSPRVRGTRPPGAGKRRFERFIPACAGNTGEGLRPIPRISVHPRVCGEHFDKLPRGFAHAGSSPRVRGTHVAGRATRLIQRFIPACAGNTTMQTNRLVALPVHPRVCGEHRLLAASH